MEQQQTKRVDTFTALTGYSTGGREYVGHRWAISAQDWVDTFRDTFGGGWVEYEDHRIPDGWRILVREDQPVDHPMYECVMVFEYKESD